MKTYYLSNNLWTAAFWNFQEDMPATITVQSNNSAMGSATVMQQPTCTNNQAVILATPNNGYYFKQWSDGATANPRIVEVTQDITLTAIFEVLSGIETIKDNELTIYPNPVKGQLQVTGYELQDNAYCIFSVTGQVLMQGSLSGETTIINVEHLSNGVYFIKVGNVVEKFVKK